MGIIFTPISVLFFLLTLLQSNVASTSTVKSSSISNTATTTNTLSASKLSIHVNAQVLTSVFLAWVNATRPRVLKLLDPPPGSDVLVKQASPATILVGRIYTPTQPVTGDATLQAQLWFNASLQTIQACPYIDYWEGYNEIYAQDVPTMTWYNDMEVERVRLLAMVGVKASIGQFSSGCPDVTNASVIEAFYGAIDAAIAHNGVLGLHEYSSPTMLGCFDNSTQQGWLTGRYRKLYAEYLIPTNRSAIPLIISESGIDNSPCGNSPNFGGWQNYCNYWKNQTNPPLPGPTNCPEQYVYQLSWYDSILREDDYVLGTTLFCWQCSGFASYEVDPILEPLQVYMNGLSL